MTHQRRRGQVVKVWKSKLTTDMRGNQVIASDFSEAPYEVTAAVIPVRSSRAEVAGQQIIDVVRLILDPDLEDVTLWSRVYYAGDYWDIDSPPAYHHGSRHTRHWSLDIRRRP